MTYQPREPLTIGDGFNIGLGFMMAQIAVVVVAAIICFVVLMMLGEWPVGLRGVAD